METNDIGVLQNDAEPPIADTSEVDEVDNLSTNENKQMDRQMEEEMNEETASNSSNEEENAELKTASKILSDLMADSKKAVNWPFMDSIEFSAPDLYDEYKKRIEKPMWLRFMKKKFDERSYRSITEFVSDFRLMLENCYRFNGPDHYVSKRGQKLETMLEQKLALLSRELREKTSIEATSGIIKTNDSLSPGVGMRRRQKTLIPHDSTNLLNQLREQEQQKVREWRKQQIIDRKAEKEALAQEILDWEDTVLFCGKYKEHMKAMWELPQIGLFLFLCQVPLNIGEVMHFELERCFLLPRESSTMQLIMTSLLSTPFQRLKIDKKTLMPYQVWEHKLRIKLQQWYKVYIDNEHDAEKSWLKLGIEGTFFEIVGQKNPLDKKKFHELTFYKRVWIVKSLCDYCLQTQDSIRETIELQPFADQREYLLGTDADGKRYIHFPQFCGADVRVYRQAPMKYPKIDIKPDHFDNKRKFPLVYKPPPTKKMRLQKKKTKVKKPEKPSPQPSPTRQRPSRLRQSVKPVIPLQIGDSTENTEESEEEEEEEEISEEEESDNHKMDVDGTGDCDRLTAGNGAGEPIEMPGKSGVGDNKHDLNDRDGETEDKSVDDNDRLSSGSDVTIAYCDNSDTNSSYSSPDYSRESSPFMPSDLRVRRSARLDKLSDASREASPLIYDSDYGMSRSGRRRTKLKTPSYRASRNLTNLLMDENSTTSNSSAFGEPNISGILTERLLNNANLNSNSNSSETGEESNDCDIRKLFSNAGNDSTHNGTVSDPSKEQSKGVDNDKDGSNKEVSDGEMNESICESKSESLTMNGDADEVKGQKSTAYTEDSNETPVDDITSDHMSTENIPNGDLANDEMGDKATIISELDTRTDSKDVLMDEVKRGHDSNRVENGEACTEVELFGQPGVSVKNNTGIMGLDRESVESPNSGQTEEMLHKVQENADESNGVHYDESYQINDNNTTEENIDIDKNDKHVVPNGMIGEQTITPDDVHISLDKIKQEPKNESYFDNNEGTLKNPSEVKQETSTDGSSLINSKPTICDVIAISNVKAEDSVKVKMEVTMDETLKEQLEKCDSEIKDEPQSESEEEEEEEEKFPDLNDFELLADSVEDLRQLTLQFEEQEPIIIKKGKKEQITRPPPRKKCVVHLHERLQFLLKELEPWESRLVQATKRARIRLRKEMEDYEELPETEDAKWNTTDEETESGGSDDESDKPGKDAEDSKDGSDFTGKFRSSLLAGRQSRENLSGASTPVKMEDLDEIDISQRGRLRKRRIIPNNAEDQIAPKKVKPKIEAVTIQDTPTSSQPIIIQSGKSQMVDYSDILRQLKSVNSKGGLPPGVSPVLIKTTQGGRTLLTSVLPLNTSESNSGSSVTQKLQNIRMISPLALQQQLVGQNVQLSLPVIGTSSSSTKVSQHPTIQNLLAGNVSIMPPGVKEVSSVSPSGSILQVLPQTSMQSEGVILQSGKPGDSTLLTPVKAGQSATVMITPEKSGSQDLFTPQKIILNQNITPRKIAPHPMGGFTGQAVKGTVKYYAANASTLPINVVQQLLATRGAKLQTGPNQQSILYIPMENDGESRNVVPLQGKYVTSIPQSQSNSTVSDSQAKLSTATNTSSQGSTGMSTQPTVVPTTKSKSPVTSNMLILPKPQTVPSTSPAFNFNVSLPSGFVAVPVQQGTRSVSPNSSTPMGISKTVKTIFQSRLAAGGIALSPTSPPRYPTNETVRTLLDKRKSVDEKTLALKSAVESKLTAYTCIASQLQRPCPTSMASSVILKKIAASADPNTSTVTSTGSSMMTYNALTKDSTSSEDGDTAAVQQHVLTSISPAKLNTLLLQTTAAGAKSIPSLIKLPSKAVLDSAVKAVVTSVNTTLPTVNIKVPSPTSLPSIGLRRNVTKTIQTMKSPIPVAPKVVTQNSGRTSLSVADSHCLLSTQSTVSTSCRMGNSTQMPVQSNTTPVQAHVQTQVAAIVQGSDGKKVLTKLPSQNSLSSDPVMQVGYLTPQGYVIPKLQQNPGSQSASAILNQLGIQSQVKQELTGTQTATPGMQLVQNAEGLLQLVPKGGVQTQIPTSKATILQLGNQVVQSCKKGLLNKQVVAINAQGKHIIVKQKVPTGQQSQVSPSDPTVILPKSMSELSTPLSLQTITAQPPSVSITSGIKPTVISPSLELKSGANYLLPQTASGILNTVNPIQSPAGTQPAFSPLLNMQQVLLPGAGFQLASPVMNPVGMNLLQSNLPLQSPTMMPSSQNVNLQSPGVIQSSPNINVQTSMNSPAVQHVVNINPNLLNQALLTNMGQHQLKDSPALNVSTHGSGTSSRPLLPSQSLAEPSTLLLKDKNVNNSKEAGTKLVHPREQVQLTFRQNHPGKLVDSSKGPVLLAAGVTLPSSSSLNLATPLPSTPAKQMVFQYAIPSQGMISPTLKQSLASQSVTSTATSNGTVLSTGRVTPKQLFVNDHHLDKNLVLQQIARTVPDVNSKLLQGVETHAPKVGVGEAPGLNNTKPVEQSSSVKSNQTNQKLLLYSIGGQLVTGQGVPVTLHQGVLKVMPQGKLQIANQTLTQEQIKQTLAKLGSATVNPDPVPTVDAKPGPNVQSGIPVQTIHHEKPFIPTSTIMTDISAMDHAYQHKQRIGSVSARVKRVSSSSGSDTDIKQELDTDGAKADIVVKGAKSNSVYIMKPMSYSSGYTVFPSAIKNEDLQSANSVPVVREMNLGTKSIQGQGQFHQSAIKKVSVSMGVNGREENIVGSDSVRNLKDLSDRAHSVVKANSVRKEGGPVMDEEEDDDEGNHLIIDDSANEKEAALNLLTLANQAFK